MTDIRITKARSQLIIEHPFFGSLAMNLVVREAPGMATMATDGKHLFYRPGFLDEPDITPLEVKRFVAHEVGHCMLGHHTRRGSRDPDRYNIACDHAVNLILKSAGFKIPPDRYCDERFRNMTAERIYAILEADEKANEPEPEEQPEDEQSPEPESGGDEPEGDDDASPESNGNGDEQGGDGEQEGGDGQPGDGGNEQGDGDGAGQGGQGPSGDSEGTGDGEPVSHGDPGRDGEVLDAAPAHDQAALDESAQEWEVFTRQAVNIARKQGEGKLPGFLETVVEHLDDPRTDWREVYRRFVDPMSAKKDYSWTQPNRRMMSQGFYVPGLVSDGVQHVAIIIDSSGSVDEKLLAKFAPEAQASLDEGAIDKITLIFADTDVRSVKEYTTGEQLDFTVVGRGGTDFAPSFAWINEHAPDVACAVLFSDLECTSYGPEPAYDVLLCGYGDPARLKFWLERAPFGEAVDVTL